VVSPTRPSLLATVASTGLSVTPQRAAEIGRAGAHVEPAALLVEGFCEPPHLGGESGVAAPDLADEAGFQQHALCHIGPVDQPDFDARIVIEPAHQVGLVQAGRGEGAGNLAAADDEAEFGRCLGRLQRGRGGEDRILECERSVMVGEAEHEPVAPRQAPAAAERRRALFDMGGKAGGDGAHRKILRR
jgi:hypothetical protein